MQEYGRAARCPGRPHRRRPGRTLGQAAEAAARTFGDAQSFLEEFFPGRADELLAGATEVRTLAGYVEALGGRLDIIADFGTERILLPNSPLGSAD